MNPCWYTCCHYSEPLHHTTFSQIQWEWYQDIIWRQSFGWYVCIPTFSKLYIEKMWFSNGDGTICRVFELCLLSIPTRIHEKRYDLEGMKHQLIIHKSVNHVDNPLDLEAPTIVIFQNIWSSGMSVVTRAQWEFSETNVNIWKLSRVFS